MDVDHPLLLPADSAPRLLALQHDLLLDGREGEGEYGESGECRDCLFATFG